MKNIQNLFISKSLDIKNIISIMSDESNLGSARGIVLVVDKNQSLIGTITDGDIRRSFNKDDIVLASDIMNDNPLSFPSDYSFSQIIEDIPKKLKNRNNKSRQFLSNIILVDKNNIPIRLIAYHELWQKHNVENKKITVVGIGYVGLTLSLALADSGLMIFGHDIDKSKIKLLREGNTKVRESGINRLLKEHVNHTFFPSASLIGDSDIYIICVSTPVEINTESLSPIVNLSYIEKSVQDIGKIMKKGSLIIFRSTIPIGFTRSHLIPKIENISGYKCGLDFKVSFAPERTVEGMAMSELRELPQVIGGYDDNSFEETSKIFSKLTSTIVKVDSLESAEMVKLINNSFRDYVFAFSNKLSMIASENNLDINHIINSANKGYPRNPIPSPSPGVGGPCLTKDPFIFSSSVDDNSHNVFKLSREINQKMHNYIADKVYNQIKIQKHNMRIKPKILICGLAFKGNPETGDLRDSSSLEIYNMMKKNDVDIYGYDFVADEKEIVSMGVSYHNIKDGLKGFDVLMFLNNHEMNIKLNFFDLVRQMNDTPIFFDGWSQFQKEEILKIKPCFYMNLSLTEDSI
jgi:UDP-N-acetyl-D-mannosaminuronic acid dehydrogenase